MCCMSLLKPRLACLAMPGLLGNTMLRSPSRSSLSQPKLGHGARQEAWAML